mgnify:CR=1 FL=1
MKKLLRKFILFLFNESFFFDDQAKPIKKLNNKFLNLKPFKKYSFGQKNKNKSFLVINRSPGAGIFSNVTFVINYFLYSKKRDLIPMVDMENFPTIYNEKNKINYTLNAWEYYFQNLNKYKLKDIYKSKNVYFTDSNFIKGMHLDINTNNLRKNFRIIKIKKQLLKKEKNYYDKNFLKTDKILGVHFRGSTYKTARGHAFPPTIKIMKEEIKKVLNEYNYNKIFLVTEETEYLREIKKEFGNICYYYNSFRMNKLDSFKIYPRKNHRYKLGEETIIETLTLSKCDGLIFIKSNVISAAINLSKKKQNKHELFLGYNSRNKFIARWLWYIKRLLPKYIGGLKIIEK